MGSDNTLSSQAYHRIKEKIISGDYRGEPHTTENRLVEELGMSRTPIREALSRLHSEGLVKVIPKKGVLILEPSVKETSDYYDLRLAIELHVLKQLCGNLTEEDFTWLEACIQQQKEALQAEDYDSWMRLDKQFHHYFLHLFGNEVFLQMTQTIRERVYYTPTPYRRKGYYTESTSEHADLLTTLRQCDQVVAEQILSQHILRGKIQSMGGQ